MYSFFFSRPVPLLYLLSLLLAICSIWFCIFTFAQFNLSMFLYCQDTIVINTTGSWCHTVLISTNFSHENFVFDDFCAQGRHKGFSDIPVCAFLVHPLASSGLHTFLCIPVGKACTDPAVIWLECYYLSCPCPLHFCSALIIRTNMSLVLLCICSLFFLPAFLLATLKRNKNFGGKSEKAVCLCWQFW